MMLSVQCLWAMPLVAVPTGLMPDLLSLDVHLLEQSMNGICYDQHLLEQSADRNSLFTTWSSLRMEHAYLSLRFIHMEKGGLLECVWKWEHPARQRKAHWWDNCPSSTLLQHVCHSGLIIVWLIYWFKVGLTIHAWTTTLHITLSIPIASSQPGVIGILFSLGPFYLHTIIWLPTESSSDASLGENRWATLLPSTNSELSITHTKVPGPSICSWTWTIL